MLLRNSSRGKPPAWRGWMPKERRSVRRERVESLAADPNAEAADTVAHSKPDLAAVDSGPQKQLGADHRRKQPVSKKKAFLSLSHPPPPLSPLPRTFTFFISSVAAAFLNPLGVFCPLSFFPFFVGLLFPGMFGKFMRPDERHFAAAAVAAVFTVFLFVCSAQGVKQTTTTLSPVRPYCRRRCGVHCRGRRCFVSFCLFSAPFRCSKDFWNEADGSDGAPRKLPR